MDGVSAVQLDRLGRPAAPAGSGQSLMPLVYLNRSAARYLGTLLLERAQHAMCAQ